MSDDDDNRDDGQSLEEIMSGFGTAITVLSPEELAKATADREAKEARKEQAEHNRDWNRAIPQRYQWAAPNALELKDRAHPIMRDGSRPPLSVVFSRIAGHDGNIVFVGAAGAGKTSLATAAFRTRFDKRSRGLVFAPAHELGVARIQHSAGHGEAHKVERAMNAKLLLLDDLGNERPTATNAVPDIILARHERNLPTWITTGVPRDDLAKLYGGGVMRRIFEGALVIECRKGESK